MNVAYKQLYMETIYFNSTPCHTYGKLPKVGDKAPEFSLTTPQLANVSLADYAGKKVVLNIFPSLDTPVCQASVRRFNQEASSLKDTVVLCISMDLPFAAARFCSAEGLNDVIPASAFRAPKFGEEYGVQIVDGPLAGLLARAVVIVDKDGTVAYADINSEITEEPHYKEALDVLKL